MIFHIYVKLPEGSVNIGSFATFASDSTGSAEASLYADISEASDGMKQQSPLK